MIKLGLLTSILDDYTFEQAVDFANETGFKYLEIACWPKGESERRYAGVSHIDCERVCLDDEYASHIRDYADKRGVRISSLAFYPNTMDSVLSRREANINHLKLVMRASQKLGIGMVSTFIGRDQSANVDDNISLFMSIWPELISLAENLKVRIAIENCPMLFGADQWPGGQNLMCTPVIFKKLFELVPSDYFGLNFDPSHYVWQGMDYIKTIYEFSNKIFHVHFKDIKLYPEKLAQCGVLAYPLDYMSPKIPGLGDVNWPGFISALNDVRYDGCAAIEIEDKSFEGSKDDILSSIRLSKKYLSQYI